MRTCELGELGEPASVQRWHVATSSSSRTSDAHALGARRGGGGGWQQASPQLRQAPASKGLPSAYASLISSDVVLFWQMSEQW